MALGWGHAPLSFIAIPRGDSHQGCPLELAVEPRRCRTPLFVALVVALPLLRRALPLLRRRAASKSIQHTTLQIH